MEENKENKARYTISQVAEKLKMTITHTRSYMKKINDAWNCVPGTIAFTDDDIDKIRDIRENERQTNKRKYNFEELKAAIDDYIDSNIIETPRVKTKIVKHKDKDDEYIETPVLSKNGKQIIDVELAKPLTITGLCLHIGILKETLDDYSKDEELKKLVGYAKQQIENYLQLVAMNEQYNVTGALFNLKCNFGYNDKQGQNLNVNLDGKVENLLRKCEDKGEF